MMLNNPLAEYLKPYLQTQSAPESDRQNVSTFEINSKDDIEYVEPDKSGRLQMVYCRPEKRVYVGRYNFARQEMDWEAFLSEGEVNLSKNTQNDDIGKIAEALVLVADKLEVMHTEVKALKNDPTNENSDTGRRANGQFKKKGEK